MESMISKNIGIYEFKKEAYIEKFDNLYIFIFLDGIKVLIGKVWKLVL